MDLALVTPVPSVPIAIYRVIGANHNLATGSITVTYLTIDANGNPVRSPCYAVLTSAQLSAFQGTQAAASGQTLQQLIAVALTNYFTSAFGAVTASV